MLLLVRFCPRTRRWLASPLQEQSPARAWRLPADRGRRGPVSDGPRRRTPRPSRETPAPIARLRYRPGREDTRRQESPPEHLAPARLRHRRRRHRRL